MTTLDRQLAVALKYIHEHDIAPRITAKGHGFLAKKIIEIAKKNNVPVLEDEDIVKLLFKLDIGDYIPETLYKAIAEILAYIYLVNKNYKG